MFHLHHHHHRHHHHRHHRHHHHHHQQQQQHFIKRNDRCALAIILSSHQFQSQQLSWVVYSPRSPKLSTPPKTTDWKPKTEGFFLQVFSCVFFLQLYRAENIPRTNSNSLTLQQTNISTAGKSSSFLVKYHQNLGGFSSQLSSSLPECTFFQPPHHFQFSPGVSTLFRPSISPIPCDLSVSWAGAHKQIACIS